MEQRRRVCSITVRSSGLIGCCLQHRRSRQTALPDRSSDRRQAALQHLWADPQCAREDSNLHGPFSPQGPQPCASTNSATGAEAASIARSRPPLAGPGWPVCACVRGLSPSLARASLSNTCSTYGISPGQTSKELAVDLTKRQQEIFDFIKRYSASQRLSPDRARHRQGGRTGVVVDGPRALGEPRADRPAPPGPDKAPRDRVARPGGGGSAQLRQARAAARRPGCGRPAGARRGEHRGLRGRRRRSRAATTAGTCCGCAASR